MTETLPKTTGADLIPNVSIELVIERREKALALAETICNAAEELEAMGGSYSGDAEFHASGIVSPRIILDAHNKHRCTATVKDMMDVVDANLWEWMLQRSGLWTFMDAKARKLWQDQKEKFDFPPMTRENILGAFEQIHSQRGDMVSRGVDELFQKLSRHHKTNKPQGFTKKVIREYVCTVWGTGVHKHLTVCHHATNELDDLNRVLHVLRGIPEPEWQQSNGYSLVRTAVDEGFADNDMVADFPFFTVKVFKKGTGHVVFKDPEDIKRLNKVLSVRHGGMRIATPRHKK